MGLEENAAFRILLSSNRGRGEWNSTRRVALLGLAIIPALLILWGNFTLAGGLVLAASWIECARQALPEEAAERACRLRQQAFGDLHLSGYSVEEIVKGVWGATYILGRPWTHSLRWVSIAAQCAALVFIAREVGYPGLPIVLALGVAVFIELKVPITPDSYLPWCARQLRDQARQRGKSHRDDVRPLFRWRLRAAWVFPLVLALIALMLKAGGPMNGLIMAMTLPVWIGRLAGVNPMRHADEFFQMMIEDLRWVLQRCEEPVAKSGYPDLPLAPQTLRRPRYKGKYQAAMIFVN